MRRASASSTASASPRPNSPTSSTRWSNAPGAPRAKPTNTSTSTPGPRSASGPESACCSACCWAGVERSRRLPLGHGDPVSQSTEEPGLVARVRALVSGLLEIVETRLELVGADLELQAGRLRLLATLLLGGLLFLALALLFVSVLAIAAFWDTHRLAAIAAVAAIHLAAGTGCLLWLRRLVRNGPRPFDATIAELRQDIARLR
ncbi:MAG: hypothetical protein DWB43_13205 [Lautropia sp.]|nr:hypothetical protein [Lautropia sp.]MDL1908340.1 hypothetical protein [Betaproteobacteria bacterium PRO1]